MTIYHLIPLIPLIPFLMAAVNGLLFGRKADADPKRRFALQLRAIGAVAASCVISYVFIAGGFLKTARLEEVAKTLPKDSIVKVYPEMNRVVVTPVQWLGTITGDAKNGEGDSTWGFMIDPLSAIMLSFVTLIGTLIHVFSVRYMDHDDGHYKFFSYLNLFMGSMLTLVLGSSLAVLFVGWEGVGVCSYLLIGFYYDRIFDGETGLTCADAGRKAFITNRVGDLFFSSGLLILLANLGTVNFAAMEALVKGGVAEKAMPHGLLVVSVLLLFLGATAKSAQIPLYVWLPDAMAGPTPVSALIHAATMVTAGVYMLVRLNFLTALTPEALGVVALVGALTAVFAASMGITAHDIKKVLAYSTVSQLGYMFLGVGVGAAASGLFHVFTHAFFKALMFLGAGAVIYSLHHVQDLRHMGQLAKKLPKIHFTFLMGVIAIAGIAPFAGFWSKDEILWQAISNNFFAGVRWFGRDVHWLGYAVYGLGILGACMTPFYMGRLYYLVFHNSDRTGGHDDHGHDSHGIHEIKEPDWWITLPLQVLAAGAVFAGFLGMGFFPKLNLWEHWLKPVLETSEGITEHRLEAAKTAGGKLVHLGHPIEYALAAVSVALGVIFLFGLARRLYQNETAVPARVAAKLPRLHALLSDKWRIDELYATLCIEPFHTLCRWAFALDRWVVDGTVNLTAKATLLSARTSWFTDKIVVDGAGVNGTGWLVRSLSALNGRWQSGQVQRYAAGFTAGIVAVLALYYFWI